MTPKLRPFAGRPLALYGVAVLDPAVDLDRRVVAAARARIRSVEIACGWAAASAVDLGGLPAAERSLRGGSGEIGDEPRFGGRWRRARLILRGRRRLSRILHPQESKIVPDRRGNPERCPGLGIDAPHREGSVSPRRLEGSRCLSLASIFRHDGSRHR